MKCKKVKVTFKMDINSFYYFNVEPFDESNLKELKPYQIIKAEKEIQWRIECAEDEAFINAL